MKLIMTKGLPGSGKTTWAKAQNAYRVNKDDLRTMMNNGKWSHINETYVLMIRDAIVRMHLADKNDVIVDDTNLHPKHEAALRQIAQEFDATFEVKDFSDVPLEECIKRDQKRSNYVGEKVIKNMWKQYFQPKVEVVEREPYLPDAIICDIDGTLALFGDANPYDRDFSKDQLNHNVWRVLMRTSQTDHKVIVVSGRMGKYKQQTKDWLSKNVVPCDALFMRPTDDVRKDVEIKKEIYEKHIKGKYNVLCVFDDRDQVVEMWRAQGLTCLQVANGDF